MDAFDSKHLRMGAKGAWLELSLQVDPEAVEAVSEVLARYGYQGGIVIEEAHRPADDGVSLERDPTRPAWVRSYLPQNHVSDETIQRIETALSLLGELRPISPLQVTPLSDQDWAQAWKKHYSVLHISERIVVVPAWKRFRARHGQVTLRLDPGVAFGTGIHPTTQLCLRTMERLLRPDMRVLDLGTGSGILAIAAAKLGCGPILAVDKDPVAVKAARANIRRNRLSARIEVREGTLVPGMGPYDMILGNLLAPVLHELGGVLAQALAPGGILIASGVLSEQGDEVTTALEGASLRFVERVGVGDWIALVMAAEVVDRA
jgi:ribosomal protein L11 methyltransferase